MVSRQALERAILEQQIWLERLASLEGTHASALSGKLSELTEAIIRAIGTNTNASGAAIANDEHLARVMKAVRSEYIKIRAELNGDYTRLFKEMGESATRANLATYKAMSRNIYDDLKLTLDGFKDDLVPGLFNDGRANWLRELNRVQGDLESQLAPAMRKALAKGNLSGLGQRGLARELIRLPGFRHENLPALLREPERIFGGKLGTNQALENRAKRIVRDEVADRSNRMHEAWTKEAGLSHYVNYNPLDSRTTDICLDASRQEAMTLEEWDASSWGRPQRHFGCRSHMLAVPDELRGATGEPEGVSIEERDTANGAVLVIQEAA